MSEFNPWRDTPRKSIFIVLLSAFLLFTTVGFANDIMAMGLQQTTELALSAFFAGLFAIFYAVGSISLRKKWYMAVIPIFAAEYLTMYFLANHFPNRPMPDSITGAELGRIHGRLIFDSIATMAVVSLGYAGFFWVSVHEALRFVKTRTANVLFESEMAAARQIQQVLIPNPHQSFPGFAVESVYTPAREVGGDFFQIMPVAEGDLLIVVGDVAGKGLPAAMLVSLLIGSIRATAEETHDPAILLGKLHNQIIGQTADGFATALAAFIADDGSVTLANAGHLSPYLDGNEIDLPGALPLGIGGSRHYETTSAHLSPGSRLTFLSDGVVEAQNPNGELFGFDRAKAISREPAASIAEAAVQFGQSDDITVVTVERRPAN
jgi:hypothetical protein